MSEENYNWNKFDKAVDVDEIKKDIKDAEDNSGDYPEIPDDTYEVSVAQMELKESKKGDPMLSIRYKIESGEYKGSLIFYNGVMQPNSQYVGLQIHNNDEMLRSLGVFEDDEVEFNGFKDYADLIMDIAEEVSDNDEYHYELEQTTNKKNKDFKDLKILKLLD
ncbi:DUF669 domain-containing protein [Companilactobacillus nodensis]|uniref:DUF669 domain-containing protein n=1 Tax=Companilactobacillus nodensis DSM 19682 = JCM 14932 = NBRC 107160 TaxID=1423775 RepID=A0A0R1K4T9_9LACO|nr:DUF669 domain-containing protein [Companilactobacillus nodensis]KRK78501.1 hypothetical protein FD03_GL002274 [Companilactobacillus nodensis DSM 19682 = JCM 14932 = NBRC 107160]